VNDEVQWGRTKIQFSYTHRDRKTLAIHVHPDLTVSVDAPHGTELCTIKERITKRGSWIKRAWRDFELYLPKQPHRQYINGESHRYLGRQYRLKALKGKNDKVKCYQGYFTVTYSGKRTAEKIKILLDRWYLDKAEAVFNKRYDECCTKIKRIGINPPLLKIRTLRTRWGSCTKSGKIILNKELIKAPIECIDYVIMHELCHLKEYNHGPSFWRLLQSVMPDYKERKNKLNLCADL